MHTGIPSWRVLKLMALGAVSFWTPDIIWHAIRGSAFGRFDVLAVTVLMPATLMGIYALLRKRLATTPHESVGLPLMLGMWTMGMFFMDLAATVSGDGFVGPYPWDGVIASLLGLLLLPTFVAATYDGSLGALVVATLAAIVIAVSRRRKQGRLQSGPNSFHEKADLSQAGLWFYSSGLRWSSSASAAILPSALFDERWFARCQLGVLSSAGAAT